jgi:hypothetical protein
MLAPFSVSELPVATTEATTRSLLEEYATTPLPAVVVRGLGASTVHEAVKQITPMLPEGMSTNPATRDYEFGKKGKLGVIGLHRDHYPPRPDAVELPITYHFTTGGLAVASFFGAGPDFMERHLQAESITQLTTQLGKNVAQGMVDTDLADPTCYRTTVESGTLVIFKNGLPLWHLFDGDADRISTAFDSTMAITPGMEVQTYDGALPGIGDGWDAPLPALWTT